MEKVRRSTRGSPGEIRRHGDGIYSRWNKRRQGWDYRIQYYWHDPQQGRARRVTETVPADKDGKRRLETAKRFKAKREKEKHRPEFVPLPIKKRRARDEAQLKAATAAPLIFENAAKRFLDACADEYANPVEVRAVFRAEKGGATKLPGPLHLAFAGRRLDELTRVDIRHYYQDRLTKKGPFSSWPRKTGMRVPQTEITLLSALYTFLQDEGYEIDNPCHRPRTRRRDGLLRPYKPKHEPVIPNHAARAAIFSARVKGLDGRELIAKEHRTLWQLCFYTAARPESEPCRLTHGDVEFSQGDRWGTVTYRNTKTGGDRRILLHPDVEANLREIMDPVPLDSTERDQWKRRPIFRRRGAENRAWNQSSYVKAWRHTIAVAASGHPEVAGMWLRDFRVTAKTVMIDAGVSELVVNRILGHTDGVAGRYYRLSDAAMRSALETLGPVRAAAPAAGQHGQDVKSVASRDS